MIVICKGCKEEISLLLGQGFSPTSPEGGIVDEIGGNFLVVLHRGCLDDMIDMAYGEGQGLV